MKNKRVYYIFTLVLTVINTIIDIILLLNEETELNALTLIFDISVVLFVKSVGMLPVLMAIPPAIYQLYKKEDDQKCKIVIIVGAILAVVTTVAALVSQIEAGLYAGQNMIAWWSGCVVFGFVWGIYVGVIRRK